MKKIPLALNEWFSCWCEVIFRADINIIIILNTTFFYYFWLSLVIFLLHNLWQLMLLFCSRMTSFSHLIHLSLGINPKKKKPPCLVACIQSLSLLLFTIQSFPKYLEKNIHVCVTFSFNLLFTCFSNNDSGDLFVKT